MSGKVWKFEDNISTDDIAPGRYFYLRSNLPELAKHAFKSVNPKFASQVKKGDFIVAGKNFGLGSSREHAASILKLLGIEAILAKSFARIFFRNAINLGLPVLNITSTKKINQGDKLEVNFTESLIRNLTQGFEIKFHEIPSFMLKILKEGGLISYIKKYHDFPT